MLYTYKSFYDDNKIQHIWLGETQRIWFKGNKNAPKSI